MTVDRPVVGVLGETVTVSWQLDNAPTGKDSYVMCATDGWIASNATNGIYLTGTSGSSPEVVRTDVQYFSVVCMVSQTGSSTDAVRYADQVVVLVGDARPPYTTCSNNGGACRAANEGCASGTVAVDTLGCPTGNPRDVCCIKVESQSSCANSYGLCVSGSCGANQKNIGSCGAGQVCCQSDGTVPTSPPLPFGPPAPGPGPGPNPIAPPSPSADSPSLIPCGRNIDDKNTGDIDETKPCTLCHIVLGGQKLISWGLRIMSIIAITVIFAMGVLYILSAGNSSMMETAKGGMIASLIGFAVMLSAYLIVNVVLTILVDTASPDKPFLNLTATPGYFNFACDITSNVNGK